MRNRGAFLWAGLITVCAAVAWARNPALLVEAPWVRQPPPGADTAAVYLTLRNDSDKAAVVVAVESAIASHAMIHETRTEGGQSRMRPHEQLLVPAGKTVKLEPEGLHVMLHGLKHPLAAGQSVPITLVLQDGERLSIDAPVRPLSAP